MLVNLLLAKKSRRDYTLLTVDFNLRKMNYIPAPQSPARTTLVKYAKYRPCGTLGAFAVFPIRRLKPAVNKMLSLRDIA